MKSKNRSPRWSAMALVLMDVKARYSFRQLLRMRIPVDIMHVSKAVATVPGRMRRLPQPPPTRPVWCGFQANETSPLFPPRH